MSAIIVASVTTAQILLVFAMACATFRMLGARGPRPGGRFRQPVCECDAASSRLWRRVTELTLLRGGSDTGADRVREHGSACEILASVEK